MDGEFYQGNELLAKGNIIRNNKNYDIASVNFIANPRGHIITDAQDGKITSTEKDARIAAATSFTATTDESRTLDATTLA
ncbi:hypothetical protein INT80_00635 [Gallibacterium anatis]|uniref:Uncharacterized protein n=1 Tax=Gallibacterium anatis TaxID=750 RepID=A0A930UVV4_9PAST|nr:hypothetical protein [Gallibacterium anatis]